MNNTDDDDLLDYCAECVRRHGCGRLDTLRSPFAIHWEGGCGIRTHYICERGHVWTCWWSATYWFGTGDDEAPPSRPATLMAAAALSAARRRQRPASPSPRVQDSSH